MAATVKSGIGFLLFVFRYFRALNFGEPEGAACNSFAKALQKEGIQEVVNVAEEWALVLMSIRSQRFIYNVLELTLVKGVDDHGSIVKRRSGETRLMISFWKGVPKVRTPGSSP
ncbi:hypothetical protein BDZ97DRAFT_1763750 [Flammula alnicola]|nr:hypothetical protein BDZ97DRAFT_1763750 [Flammula alnicola]